MLVIGVFGREVRFKPINKVDAGTGATIVWPANFLETWARAQSRDNQTSASSKVGKRFVIGVSRIFSNVARIDESPVSIDSIYPSDAYFTLALNFLSPRPIGDNEISSRNANGIFSQRDQLSSVSLFSPIFVKKQRIRLAICNLSLRYNFLRKSAQGVQRREIKRNFYYVTRSTRGERMHPTVCPNSITCSTCPCYRYTLCFHGKCDSRTWKFQTGIAE